MDDKKHKKYTGVSNKLILKNLEYLVETKKEVHIRFPLIPNINDQANHLENLAEYLSSLKYINNIFILPYHKIAQGKYEQLNFENKMNGIQEPTKDEVENTKFFFEKSGFNVKIGG